MSGTPGRSAERGAVRAIALGRGGHPRRGGLGPAQQRPDRRPRARRQGGHLPPVADHGGPGADARRAGSPGLDPEDAGSLRGRPRRPGRALDPAAGPRGAGRGEHRRRRAARGGPAGRPRRRAGAAAGRRGRRDRRPGGGRGEPIEPGRLALLGSVLEAFWWQRYTRPATARCRRSRWSGWSTTSCCRSWRRPRARRSATGCGRPGRLAGRIGGCRAASRVRADQPVSGAGGATAARTVAPGAASS